MLNLFLYFVFFSPYFYYQSFPIYGIRFTPHIIFSIKLKSTTPHTIGELTYQNLVVFPSNCHIETRVHILFKECSVTI